MGVRIRIKVKLTVKFTPSVYTYIHNGCNKEDNGIKCSQPVERM